jgi:pectate lyase
MGFAAKNGGTRGGAGGPTVTVKTGDEFQAAVNKATVPTIIAVDGVINDANTKAPQIDIKGKHFLSVVGLPGSRMEEVGIRINGGSSNIWIDSMTIKKVRLGPKDCIGLEGDVKNWAVSRCDLSGDHAQSNKDLYDGLIDVKRGCEYGLISDNYLHNHHKACLFGHSDKDTGLQNWFITFARNRVEDIGSRGPSVRDGYVEVRDNYYKKVTTSCINVRQDAQVLIDGNVFEDVDDPIVSIDSAKIGYWTVGQNEYRNVTWGKVESKEATGQNGKTTGTWGQDTGYPALGLANVKEHVLKHAGPGADLGAPVVPQPEQPAEPVPPQPEQPAEEEPEVVDLGPIAVALDEAEAALAKVRRLLGAG